MTGWTDERKDLLKKLWSDSLTGAEIASQLGGVSRSAVLGMVHRMGLPSRAAGRRPQVAKPAPTRVRRVSTAPSPPRPARLKVAVAQPEPIPAQIEMAAPGLATILTLDRPMCKWPIGDPRGDDFTFCGRHAAGRFCAEHARVAFEPAVSKPRQKRRQAGASSFYRNY